jgi:hypothetical protein
MSLCLTKYHAFNRMHCSVEHYVTKAYLVRGGTLPYILKLGN